MSLSAEQIRWGFWNWNRSRDWPPKHITHFSDYRPSERLSLNITQLDRVSYYRQTRIVDLWCSELPNLKQGGLEFIEHFLLYKMRVKYN